MISDSGTADGQRQCGSDGNRERACARVQRDAVHLSVCREGDARCVGGGERRYIRGAVRDRLRPPVGRGIPIAGGWTRLPRSTPRVTGLNAQHQNKSRQRPRAKRKKKSFHGRDPSKSRSLSRQDRPDPSGKESESSIEIAGRLADYAPRVNNANLI